LFIGRKARNLRLYPGQDFVRHRARFRWPRFRRVLSLLLGHLRLRHQGQPSLRLHHKARLLRRLQVSFQVRPFEHNREYDRVSKAGGCGGFRPTSSGRGKFRSACAALLCCPAVPSCCTATCAHAHMRTCTHAHMCTRTHARMYTGPHARMYAGTQAHMHTCTHARVHTCTHAHLQCPCYATLLCHPAVSFCVVPPCH